MKGTCLTIVGFKKVRTFSFLCACVWSKESGEDAGLTGEMTLVFPFLFQLGVYVFSVFFPFFLSPVLFSSLKHRTGRQAYA